MITPAHVRTMAAYNAWQNGSIYAAAEGLDAAARQADRGAFFGSIEATLTHLLWADRMWLHRLAGDPPPAARAIPESVREVEGWAALATARRAMDARLTEWAAALTAEALGGTLSWYSGALGREVTKPVWLLVTHVFNHQTHHRGQVHAMLTAAGARPADTDLPFMPGLDPV